LADGYLLKRLAPDISYHSPVPRIIHGDRGVVKKNISFKIRTGAAPKKAVALWENANIDTGYRDGWTEM